MTKKSFAKDDANARTFQKMFGSGHSLSGGASAGTAAEKAQRSLGLESAPKDTGTVPSPGDGGVQAKIGCKFMLDPELHKALKYRALQDTSKNLSEHVTAALERYLKDDLAFVRENLGSR